MGSALQGLKILVTRPRGSARQLLQALQQEGATALHLPCLAIEALHPREDALLWQEGERILADLPSWDYGIFPSSNAVRHLARRLRRRKQSWPPRTRAYAVGPATAATAQRLGIPALAPEGASSSEALLKMAALRHPRGALVVIFRGCGGRAHLGNTLQARGARVLYCELYRRVTPPYRATLHRVLEGGIDIISVASGDTLDKLAQMAAGAHGVVLEEIPLVVPGRRVARHAEGLGFRTVIPAQSAATRQLVDATVSWYKTRRAQRQI